MTTRVRAIVRIAVAFVAIGAIVWWLKSRDQHSAATGAPVPAGSNARAAGGPERVVPVQVVPVVEKDVPIWLEGLGTVAAFQQVTVRSQVDGRLDSIAFTEGQPVKKGDVLAQIDPRPFLVQLHQAQGAYARDKAQLDAAKKQLERYQSLQRQNLVAQQQVEEIAGQVGALDGATKIDLAQVESAQLNLDYAKVKAPLDGVTGVRLVDAGNLVKANDPTGLVVITAIDPAAVIFSVPQDRLTAVTAAMAKAGKDAKVAVEIWNRDATQKLATGELAVLDNQINQSTATLRLKALVPNPERTLWPNAFVKARMLLETRSKALVIPAVAIQRGPAGPFVYVVAPDKTAAMKPVTVALTTGVEALIDKGLAANDQVVVEGQSQLRPGGRVELVGGKAAEKPGKKPEQ